MEKRLPLARADVEFSDVADLLVIGMGAAGASAAIEARDAGLDVLVLERASGGGGNTAMSGGYIYLGGGTRMQKANGFDDTVEDMVNYLVANTPVPDLDKIRLYCERSVEHLAWLEAQGVPFNTRYYKAKHVEVQTDETLSWTGNEKAWPYRDKARPFPRGHMPEGTGAVGGKLMQCLIKSLQDKGVRAEYDATVTDLVAAPDGRIVGARFKRFGEVFTVGARRGVLLAAGGFASNREMVEEFCPQMALEGVHIVGVPQADGSAHRLGAGAGGDLVNMAGAMITSPHYPPESLVKGIMVNKLGQRFVAEDSYHGRTTAFILQQPDHTCYLICDGATFERPYMGQKLIDGWETVEEMEAALELPAGSLQKTLAGYNEGAARGEDPLFHKHPDYLVPLTEAPYAAIDMTLGRATFGGFTLGGLRTDPDARVLDKDGKAIPGLYAAGACASNIAQDSIGYSSGTCIGESSFFGRMAGAHAAKQAGAEP